VGSQPLERLPLSERLADELPIEKIEIAEAAVDQLGGLRRRARGEVSLFEESHPEAAKGKVAGDSGARHPAPDDQSVEADPVNPRKAAQGARISPIDERT
jgi:hypothetical protein